jgi:ABC-type branched-subunit amino acid transport system permease subunit
LGDLLPFIVVGLATGSLYGLAAVGLVLTYRTSGLFNLAHGAVAAAGAYAFHSLRDVAGLPWPLALALVLILAGPPMGLLLEAVTRRARKLPIGAQIVLSIGLLLAVQGLIDLIYGSAAIGVTPFLPTRTFDLFGAAVGIDQLIVVVVAVAVTAGLLVFLRRTRTGTAVSAVVDDPELLDLLGTPPVGVRRTAWVIGTELAVLSGILLAPSIGLDSTLLTLLVIQAFGAAALGGFAHLGFTLVGGLTLGVVASLGTRWVSDVPSLAGLPPTIPFIALFVVLVAARRGFLTTPTEPVSPISRDRGTTGRILAGRGGLLLLALALVPFVVGSRQFIALTALVYVLLLASLRLLVRTAGQVSLCHLTFAAVGATTFAHLAEGAGVPWGVAVAGAGLAAVPLGALVALPAVRLSGLYLALSTLGLAFLFERLVFPTSLMFGDAGQRFAPRPAGFGSDRALYWLLLAIVAAGCVLFAVVERSRLGRLLRGLAEAPTTLATLGLHLTTTRILVFCLAAAMAGVSGALLASVTGVVSTAGFGVFGSLTLLAVIFVAGRHPFRAPVVAAGVLVMAPSYLDHPDVAQYQQLVYGLLAIAAVLLTRPREATA